MIQQIVAQLAADRGFFVSTRSPDAVTVYYMKPREYDDPDSGTRTRYRGLAKFSEDQVRLLVSNRMGVDRPNPWYGNDCLDVSLSDPALLDRVGEWIDEIAERAKTWPLQGAPNVPPPS